MKQTKPHTKDRQQVLVAFPEAILLTVLLQQGELCPDLFLPRE